MPDSSLASTLRLLPNGVIILPRNANLRIPEIRFTNIPLSTVRAFLRPLDNSSPNSIQRQALRNHHDAWFASSLQINGVRTAEGGFLGQATSEGGQYGPVRNVPDGSADGTNLSVPRFYQATADINLLQTRDVRTIRDSGFRNADDRTASTIWHELGHIYIREFSSARGGHGEAYREALTGSYNGIQPNDILSDDVLRFQFTASLAGDYFPDGTGDVFLDERSETFNNIARFRTNLNQNVAVDADYVIQRIYGGTHGSGINRRPNFEEGPNSGGQISALPEVFTVDLSDEEGNVVGIVEGYISVIDGNFVTLKRTLWIFQYDSAGEKVKNIDGLPIILGQIDTSGGLTVRRMRGNGGEIASNDILIPGGVFVDFSQAGGVLGQLSVVRTFGTDGCVN